MLCFSMSGCSVLSAVFGASGSTADTIKAEDGYAEGRIGDTLKTTFFTFRVESAKFVKEYAGYQPEAVSYTHLAAPHYYFWRHKFPTGYF